MKACIHSYAMRPSEESGGSACPGRQTRSRFDAGNQIPGGAFIHKPQKSVIERNRPPIADGIRAQSGHGASNDATTHDLAPLVASEVKLHRRAG